MPTLLEVLTSFPTAIFSALLIVVLVFWLLAIIGIVDFEHNGLDIDLDHDAELHADGDDLGALASFVVAFGLNGVPFSIVISLIVFIAWLITGLSSQYILWWIPTAILQFFVGILAILVAFFTATISTARIIRPMRKLFVVHTARSNYSLVGMECKVLTLTVTEKFGRAEVSDRGAGFNIKVNAKTPNDIAKGSRARIIAFDDATGAYEIEVLQ